jgi:hypothetical protein
MRKVVEAPPNHTVVVMPENAAIGGDGQVSARITTDLGATKVTVRNTDEVWPHRQKEFLQLVNSRLAAKQHIGPYDLLCANKKIDVLKNHPDFAHKPHKKASPQYSESYVDWILGRLLLMPTSSKTAARHVGTKTRKVRTAAPLV